MNVWEFLGEFVEKILLVLLNKGCGKVLKQTPIAFPSKIH